VAYHGFKPAEQAIQIGDDEILSSHISDGVIVNADVNASAAIATSKVSGAVTSIGSHGLGSLATLSAVASAQITDGTIVNADVNNSAAIATSKLSGSLTSVGSHGLATSATTDTTNASNISSGTLAAARVATLNQNTTGSAATLTTTRAINGVNFNGSAAITVTAAAGTLSGSTLNSGVTASSLVSLGTLTALTGGTGDLVWDTTTLVVDSSADRVGIGTASPATLLHLQGATSTGANGSLRLEGGSGSGDGGGSIDFYNNSVHQAGIYGARVDASTGKLYFRARTSSSIATALTLQGGDATFAGALTANGKLDIDASGGSGGAAVDGTYGNVMFDSNNHNYVQIGSPSDKYGALFFSDNVANAGHIYYFHTDNSMRFGTDATNALTLDSSQNATFAGEITVAGGNDYSAEFQKDVKILHAGGAPRIIIGNTTNANDYAEIAYNSSANTMRIGVQGDESTIVLDSDSNTTFGGNVDVAGGLDVTGDLTQSATTISNESNIDFPESSWGDVNTSEHRWVLPESGKYMLFGTYRARAWSVNGFGKIRLRDNAGNAIANSERMMIEVQYGDHDGANALALNMGTAFIWQISVSGADTIYLQGYSTTSSSIGIQDDSNGYNESCWIKV